MNRGLGSLLNLVLNQCIHKFEWNHTDWSTIVYRMGRRASLISKKTTRVQARTALKTNTGRFWIRFGPWWFHQQGGQSKLDHLFWLVYMQYFSIPKKLYLHHYRILFHILLVVLIKLKILVDVWNISKNLNLYKYITNNIL